ncbi:adenylate kinase 4 [Anaeramoeba flamelloides]|uniref:Adenylate kinase n=1 Tax=Anaeramoeba flamelloides TaxID=1746091 RepID=A0AAV7ZYX9_9EUKA|nr:adenylate kinase [Anaeramoeba flamelloides]KAJ6249963.1 adenylate kinase 4 [Anaeramoeba flamelloides]
MGDSLFLTFIGPPSCGKGTQSELLKRTYNVNHMSTGDLLREVIRKKTQKGKEIQKIISKGGLVPDRIIMDLLEEKLKVTNLQAGALFDGFPRTIDQAVGLDHVLGGRQRRLTAALNFEVDFHEIIKRVTGRRIHPASGRIYHTTYKPPKTPGIDDITGEPLIQRKDDTLEVLQQRMEVFNKTVSPIKEFYKAHNLIININANKSPDLVFEEITEKLATLGITKTF